MATVMVRHFFAPMFPRNQSQFDHQITYHSPGYVSMRTNLVASAACLVFISNCSLHLLDGHGTNRRQPQAEANDYLPQTMLLDRGGWLT